LKIQEKRNPPFLNFTSPDKAAVELDESIKKLITKEKQNFHNLCKDANKRFEGPEDSNKVSRVLKHTWQIKDKVLKCETKLLSVVGQAKINQQNLQFVSHEKCMRAFRSLDYRAEKLKNDIKQTFMDMKKELDKTIEMLTSEMEGKHQNEQTPSDKQEFNNMLI
jgi:hypothetical protein